MNRPIYVTIQYLLTKSGPWNVYKSKFESAQICFEQIHHNVNSIKGTVDYKFKVKLGLVTNEISMICFEKKDYFKFWILCKSDLRNINNRNDGENCEN